ncbi:MAG: hypothetical protein ABEL76_05040 [Bradymonadaceae bacterium]
MTDDTTSTRGAETVEATWQIRGDRLDTADDVRPLLRALSAFPGFEPREYDLNRKEQWRRFDVQRTAVDALTQRTQLVRVRGGTEDARAMIGLGKRGEPPTVAVRAGAGASVDGAVEMFDALFERAPVSGAFVTTKRWRETIGGVSVDWPDSLPIARVLAVSTRRLEPGAGVLDALEEPPPSLSHRRTRTYVAVDLATDGTLDGEYHRRAVEVLADEMAELFA